MDGLYNLKKSKVAPATPADTQIRKVGILRRWSTPGQTDNIRSDLQFSDMDTVIAGQGWEPVHYDDQQTSGRKSILSRREASRMLEDLREGRLQGIGAIELSRIAREPSGLDMAQFTEALLKQNAPLVLAEEVLWPSNPQDRLKIDFLRIFASYEWDQIRSRTWKSNIIRRLDRDNPTNGAKAPRGYHHVPTGETTKGKPKRKLAKDPAESPMILDFFRVAPDCLTMSEAARKMNDLGYRLPKRSDGTTRVWTYMDVYHLITQPLYSGRRPVGRWRGDTNVWELVDETKGKIPYIDQPELKYVEPHVQDGILRHWQETKEAIPATRARRSENILTGILTCRHCGGPMWVRGQNRATARGDTEYRRYLYCSRHFREVESCPGQSVKESLAIAAIYVFMQSILDNPDHQVNTGQHASALTSEGVAEELSHAQYRVGMLKEERERIADYLVKYADAPLRETFERKLVENEATLLDAERAVQDLTELRHVPEIMEAARAIRDNLPEMLLAASLSMQRKFITTMFHEVRVDGHGGGQSRTVHVVYVRTTWDAEPYTIPLAETPWMEKERRWAEAKLEKIHAGQRVILTPRDYRALSRVGLADEVLELHVPVAFLHQAISLLLAS